MIPDLERLIRLQQLEAAVATARQAIEAFPAQCEGLEARLAEHAGRLAAAEQRLAEQKATRRTLEKDVAAVQGRLTRFKDQSMGVKTNKEYHALQSEISGANAEVQRIEDLILEGMLEADELSADIETAKQALVDEQAAVGEEQRRLEQDRDRFQAQVERHAMDREAIVSGFSPRLLEKFETLMRGRKGIAVSEVHDGRCQACQVRLRPQLYNDVRLNHRLIECESCQRILYFPIAAADAAPSA
jgi:predicted  nucleic acid-binding Zn-ribbon protein